MAVPPLSARLDREWPHFLADGRAYDVRCRVHGSRPTAEIRAEVGGRELPVDYSEEEDGDDDVLTVIIRFVPKKDDHGSFLSCRYLHNTMCRKKQNSFQDFMLLTSPGPRIPT